MSTDGTDQSAPLPVPDLGGVPARRGPGSSGVSDDDRNRYGRLLDNAAERGLLSPAEYRTRLTALAEATTEEELKRIVTELPVFATSAGPTAPTVSPAGARRTAPDPGALDAAMWATLTPARSRRRSGNPWLVLVVIVIVLLVALVALALVAGHVTHVQHTGVTSATSFSRLRL